MTGPVRPAVLRPGDVVAFGGVEHLVVALSGTSVRLRADDGGESVVLLGYLLASPGFTVAAVDLTPELEPFGLLDALPPQVLAAAKEWERHVVEVQTGRPPGAGQDTAPRPGFDPNTRTVKQRDAAKAAAGGDLRR